jgi:hypothetical protein
MAKIFVLGLYVLSLLLSRSHAASVDINTSEQFRGALRNQSITTVVLRQDVEVAPEDWQTYSKLNPLVLNRNITVTSNPPGLVLDFQYIQLKVRIAKGLRLTFRELTIDQIRCEAESYSR